MYHVYSNQAAGVYLFLYFFSFVSLKFQNIRFFVTLFWEAYKVETWYTHGQMLICCVHQIQAARMYLFLYFSLFFCLSNWQKLKTCIYKIVLTYLLLMVTAGGMWALLTLCYIFFNFLSLKFQNIKFFVTFLFLLWGLQSWNLIHTWAKGWSTPYTSSQNILVPLLFFFFLSLQLAKIRNLLPQNCFNIPLMVMAKGMSALLTLC